MNIKSFRVPFEIKMGLIVPRWDELFDGGAIGSVNGDWRIFRSYEN